MKDESNNDIIKKLILDIKQPNIFIAIKRDVKIY